MKEPLRVAYRMRMHPMRKRGERLERAVKIRELALKLIGEKGHWRTFGRAPKRSSSRTSASQ